MLRPLKELVFQSPVYRYALSAGAPEALLGQPPDLWPGDPARGRELASGTFRFAGEAHRLESLDPLPGEASAAWRVHVHGFSWLGHLSALGDAPARRAAQGYWESWLAANQGWSLPAWRGDVLGSRLCHCLTHFAFLAGDAEPGFEQALLAALSAQARHLARAASRDVDSDGRIRALRGLILAGLALPDRERALQTGLDFLQVETARQVHPDGGHYSRSPAVQARVLADFVGLRETLLAAGREVPQWLQGAVDRMVPMLRALRHGDGGLALFNGAAEGDAGALDQLLARAAVRGKPMASGPHTGFHRLAAGRTVIVADTGPPADARANPRAHAGTLSFEMSVGKERLVVNCGPGQDGGWRAALSATAAHSTCVVDDTNSSEIDAAGGFRRTPSSVTGNRRQIDGAIVLEASHDGYKATFGLTHRRRIMLAADGESVTGEDNLIGSHEGAFCLRFHLHPSVQASLLEDGRSVLIRLPRGGGWRFTADEGRVSLEESVYFPSRETRKKSLQIVVSGGLEGAGATVKWQFGRIGPGPGQKGSTDKK